MTLLSFFPAVQWSIQSIALTLSSKAVYSSAIFDFPWSIILLHSLFTVFSLTILSLLRKQPLPLSRPLLTEMTIPAALFVLYQFSLARSLRFISLPAYTVVKSAAPLALTLLEAITYRSALPPGVYFAAFLTALANALTFDFSNHVSLKGYCWAAFHILVHITFVFSLRSSTASYRPTDKAYLVNLLAIPLILPLAHLNLETSTFIAHVEILPRAYLFPFTASFGLSAGCAVSVFAAYEAASSNALRYLSLFNRVAVALLGALFFASGLTPLAWTGVALGILSGYVFVYSKSKAVRAGVTPRPIVSSPSLEMMLPGEEGRGEYSALEVEEEEEELDDVVFKAEDVKMDIESGDGVVRKLAAVD